MKFTVLTMGLMLALLNGSTITSGKNKKHKFVQKDLTCENVEFGIKTWIKANLTKQRYGRAKTRELISSRLAKRITIESKRFGLDPIALTTIAWIESNYRPYVRGTFGGVGRRRNEVGIWQLIPGDFAIRQANVLIQGCPLSPKASKFQKWLWGKKFKTKQCKYPDIGLNRLHVGRFARNELRGFTIGTFLAAYEMRQHIDACKSRRPKGHRWFKPAWLRKWIKRNPQMNVSSLERYLHYNFGPKQFPKSPYRRKLFVRYSRVAKEVCKKNKSVHTLAEKRYNVPRKL